MLVARGAAESTAPLRELAGDAGVPVAFVDTGDLDALSFGGNHQGVVATLAATASAGLRDLLQPHPGRAQPPLILAADQVEDVGNLGSLVRTLEACGGAGVIVPQRRSAALTGGMARASAGASLRSSVVNVTNLARALKSLRSDGVRVIGLDAGAETPFDAMPYDAPCCIVVGNEARGMRPGVREACDAIVRVPLRSGIGSLNVAAAGAIVLHHIARQRTGKPVKPHHSREGRPLNKEVGAVREPPLPVDQQIRRPLDSRPVSSTGQALRGNDGGVTKRSPKAGI